MRMFQLDDCIRTVTASQFGQWSPSGRMTRKKTVAATARRTKNPTKMIAKTTASDIGPTSSDLQTLLYLKPGLYKGDLVLNPLDHDFGSNRGGFALEHASAEDPRIPVDVERDLTVAL